MEYQYGKQQQPSYSQAPDQQLNTQIGQPYTEFFSWGSDSAGQLGLAHAEDDENREMFHLLPRSLSFDILINSITCGNLHACFISGEGMVFSVGSNEYGQLGVADSQLKSSSAPLLVDHFSEIGVKASMVKCGGFHTAAVLENGSLYTWGRAQNGSLGTGQSSNAFEPVQAVETRHLRITFVECGPANTAAIDSNGVIYVAGDNSCKQIAGNLPDIIHNFASIEAIFPQRASQVSCGAKHSLILTQDQKVYAMGQNSEGNLGLGHTYSSNQPLLVQGSLEQMQISHVEAGRHSAALSVDGRLFVWGPVFVTQKPLLIPQELQSNKAMKQVSIGENFSLLIDEHGHLYTWGLTNNDGQLGRYVEDGDAMPQIIDHLEQKYVTQAVCGQGFGLALGQNFDQEGNIINEPEIELTGNFDKTNQNVPAHEIAAADISKISNIAPSIAAARDNTSFFTDPPRQMEMAKQSHSTEQYTGRETGSQPYQYTPAAQTSEHEEKNVQSIRKYEPPSDRPTSVERYTPQVNSRVTEYPTQRQTRDVSPRQGSTFDKSEKLDTSASNNGGKYYKIPKLTAESDSESVNSAEAQARKTRAQAAASSSNVELYNQLSQLREESFGLRQKNRELQSSINTLREENKLLITNADQEVKRMTDYVDHYTQQIDQTMEEEKKALEDQIQAEREKNEELLQKMHKEQDLMSDEADQSRRELEAIKQQNHQLLNENNDYKMRENQLEEMLERERRRVDDLEEQLRREKAQVNSIKKQQQSHVSMERRSYQQFDSQQFGARVPVTQSYTPISNNRANQHKELAQEMSASRYHHHETEIPTVQASVKKTPETYQSYSPHSNNRGYEVQKRTTQDENTVEERHQPRYHQPSYDLTSPVRQSTDQNANRQTAPAAGALQSHNNPFNTVQPAEYHPSDYKKSPFKDVMNQSHMAEGQASSYSRTNDLSLPSKSAPERESSITANFAHNAQNENSASHESGYALGDVKNRLAQMQKNKQQLEEKLKHYESKIKNHFNSGGPSTTDKGRRNANYN